MRCTAPAKINLFLRIMGRRPDGYHDIETLFQRIGLVDCLTFEAAGEEGIHLSLAPGELGQGLADSLQENLIVRAYHLMQEHVGQPLAGVRALLEKHIPMGGGLGGGSSDCAAALRGINALLRLNLDVQTLQSLAARLGSDVPFFLAAPTCIGRGRGEILTAVEHKSRFWTALAFPGVHVSTAQVYRRYDPEAAIPEGDLPGLMEGLRQGNLERVLALLYNEMEGLAFGLEPSLGYLRMKLEIAAGQVVRMSGSGSTFFTLTDCEEKAAWFAAKWQETGMVRAAVAPFDLTGATCESF